MSPAEVPWRYRLETRQSIPILVGLVGVLLLLLALGYVHARERILASARGQVAQLAGSIAREDDYNRNWLKRSMQPLVRLVATFPHATAQEQKKADARIAAILADKKRRQMLDVFLLDPNGGVTLRRYDGRNLLYVGPADPRQWTRKRIRAFRSPEWPAPEVDARRNVVLRYSVPIVRSGENGEKESIGICSLSLAISWFGKRLRTFSPFRHCTQFFLTRDGKKWTLPPPDDVPLARLKARMLARASGETSIVWNGKPYIAAYLPMADGALLLGLLIPRGDLFGDLDGLTHVLGGIGLAVLLLAAYSLHRTSKAVLSPLAPLGRLAQRLARGELEADPEAPPPPPATRFPDEAQRLRQATEKLRQALRQRVQDLALIGQTRERLFGEMTFARGMQEAMRPPALPPTPDVEVASFVHTAGDVCGDMYDYFLQRPRHLCCVMGNAAARGVPAALLTSRVIPLLHELLFAGMSPGKALENSNRILGPATSREQHMVSAFVGILDLDNGVFRWACAGQAPPFRCLGQEVAQLDWTGKVPLGIREAETYAERAVRLRPGETLLFAGPRVLSVPDARDRAYGEGALRHFLAGNTDAPEALVRALYARIRTHAGGPPQDDLTFFAVRWRGAADRRGQAPASAPGTALSPEGRDQAS